MDYCFSLLRPIPAVTVRQSATLSRVVTSKFLTHRVDRIGAAGKFGKGTRCQLPNCGVRVRGFLALPAQAGKRDAGSEQSGGVDKRKALKPRVPIFHAYLFDFAFLCQVQKVEQ